jgi:CRISPR-associated endonuclease/helicase Cas3
VNPLRAKSGKPGELLTTHLQRTLDALQAVRCRIGDIPGQPDGFWTWAALACLLHDAGKLPDGFQRMVGNTADPPEPWSERHEVLSLGFVQLLLAGLPADQRLWVAAGVAGHHRAFTCGTGQPRRLPLGTVYGHATPEDFAASFTPADQARLDELADWLQATGSQAGLPVDNPAPRLDVRQLTDAAYILFQQLMDKWEYALPPGRTDGTAAVLLLGAVTMADHLSSAGSMLDTAHPLAARYPALLARELASRGQQLRPQQQDAARVTGNLLLRSWTGSGKTEAALLWARTQITSLSEHGDSTPRLFYLLPYLASINAMADRLRHHLGSPEGIGVAHSKSASYHLARSLADDRDPAGAAVKAQSRAAATRNFRELLRVGTPYQLLRGALGGPAHSSILTDSARSVFVLDELHAYDSRRLGMILAMMRLWQQLGGRVAVLSATMPTVLADLVSSTLSGQVQLVEPPAGTPPPVRHLLGTRQAHLTSEASLAEIRGRLDTGQSVLVVANNVRDAITLYQELGKYCTDLHGEDSAHLLHSRYRRMDRTAIEAGILRRFEAGQARKPGLLVGTQVLEISLNLDLDACHTSAADLEALIQRFGRVNRLGGLPPAPVVVHEPTYASRRGSGSALWADGVYQATPTQAGWDILTRHDGEAISEQVITGWLDEIYGGAWGSQWKDEVNHSQHSFETAFLDFSYPYDDRSHLSQEFDDLFEGTEAILATDRERYRQAIEQAADVRHGRLHADEYLLPLPAWAGALSQYERDLGIRVIDAEYDPRLGLLSVNPDQGCRYEPGEVL